MEPVELMVETQTRPGATGLRKVERDMAHAASYAEWLALADEHDRLSGAADWRASDDTDLMHAPEIRRSITTLRTMREAGETWPLTKKLQELLGHSTLQMTMDLYGHLWTDPEADDAIGQGSERLIG